MRRAGPHTGEDSIVPTTPSEVIFALSAIGNPAVELSPIASRTLFIVSIRQRLSQSTFATFSFEYSAFAAMAGTDTIIDATASHFRKRIAVPPYDLDSFI